MTVIGTVLQNKLVHYNDTKPAQIIVQVFLSKNDTLYLEFKNTGSLD
jgi:hypothetical protein